MDITISLPSNKWGDRENNDWYIAAYFKDIPIVLTLNYARPPPCNVLS